MDIGKRVKQLRKQLRWTALDLAKRSDVGQSTISKIERGNVKNIGWDTIVKLANAFSMSVHEFLPPHYRVSEPLSSEEYELFELLMQLDPEERKALKELLTVLLKRD